MPEAPPGRYKTACTSCDHPFRIAIPEDPTKPIRVLSAKTASKPASPAKPAALPARLPPTLRYDEKTRAAHAELRKLGQQPFGLTDKPAPGKKASARPAPAAPSPVAHQNGKPLDDAPIESPAAPEDKTSAESDAPEDFSLGGETLEPTVADTADLPNKLRGYEWFGRRLRFALGAVLFAIGLLWLYQNNLLTAENPVVQQAKAGEVMTAITLLSDTAGKPLSVPALPTALTSWVDSARVPLTGLFLLLSAVFFFGWKASIPAVLGTVISLFGPMLGLPDAGPFSPTMLSLSLGALLILVVGWLFRK